jgi:hypothetical protein
MTSEPSAELRPYQDVLYEALGTAESRTMRDASPMTQISRLVEQALPRVTGDSAARAALLSLGAVATWPSISQALSAARDLFGSAQDFGEAIYAARCLERDPLNAAALNRARTYVLEAVVPPTPDVMAELAFDRDWVLKETTFASAWANERVLTSGPASLDLWRARFVSTYRAAHQAHRRATDVVAESVDEMLPRATAIELLNGLRGLGTPVALAPLARLRDLERLYACPLGDEALYQALAERPICPECNFTLGVAAPLGEVRRVRHAIDRGLASQQRRLSQRVIARMLAQARPTEEARLARFVQVVQAADLQGLAMVLDEEIVEFIRELLEPGPQQPDLMQRLSQSFPEVTNANLEAVVLEMRRLLASDLENAGGVLTLKASK